MASTPVHTNIGEFAGDCTPMSSFLPTWASRPAENRVKADPMRPLKPTTSPSKSFIADWDDPLGGESMTAGQERGNPGEVGLARVFCCGGGAQTLCQHLPMEDREVTESGVPGTESFEAGGPLPGIEDEGVDAACDGAGKRLERGASLLEDIRKELDSESSPAPSPQPNRRAGMDLAAGEGGPGGVDRRAGKVVRGGSLLQEQLSLAIEEEDGAEEGVGDGAEGRRRGIAAFDASKLGDMIAREEAKGVERRSFDVAQFLGTRASKVSAESVGGMDLVLWSGTWNVANKSPSGDLDDWLSISSLGAEARSADMYIVGLQEVDTSVQSAVMLETRRGQQWKDYIDSCMRRLSAGAVREEQHVRVAVRQMGSVLLCVYAKAVHMQHIAEISTAIVTVGLLGVMGNKGAVAARMRLYGKTMCAVCAHLAAGESGDAYERRIADYVEINDKVMFNACAVQVMSGGQQPMYFTPPLTIGSHKVIVWVGDLNFRVKCGYKEAVEMSQRGEYAGLRGKDELMMAMAEGRAFRDFDEGVLDFAPTYKFDEGSKEYDTSSKLRVPSWTDRVLWKGNSMRLLDYSAMHNILVSDHRPVRAVIALVSLKDATVKSPDEGRHYQVPEQQKNPKP
jgi:endonuclease/exonuclease/phosphatase family metal-dependent hydrolase